MRWFIRGLDMIVLVRSMSRRLGVGMGVGMGLGERGRRGRGAEGAFWMRYDPGG